MMKEICESCDSPRVCGCDLERLAHGKVDLLEQADLAAQAAQSADEADHPIAVAFDRKIYKAKA
jgi:hypothetical protein